MMGFFLGIGLLYLCVLIGQKFRLGRVEGGRVGFSRGQIGRWRGCAVADLFGGGGGEEVVGVYGWKRCGFSSCCDALAWRVAFAMFSGFVGSGWHV